MDSKSIDDRNDRVLSIVICIMILEYLGTIILIAGFKNIGLGIDLGTKITTVLFDIILYSGFLYCFLLKKRITADILGILALVILMVIISYIFVPENKPYIEKYGPELFLKCIPAFLLVRSIKKPEILLQYLYSTSYILIILGGLYFFFYSMKEEYRSSGYDMVFGYEMSIPIIFLLNKWFNKKIS
ncbi:hypothetical protein [Paenibacillus sp. EPM92]|uniref:hypothetical protein n=1 Tax=Paenibacillus sp. EPM92 TaxID=1561195 RepID=UPI001914D9FF|nr:hypothetical protein [Paenibacillus sp. EPM92]